MCSTPDSGNCMTMFQSGSKYYLWNPIEGGIWEIVTSMDLVDIVTTDGQAGTQVAEDCGGRSGVFWLILGFEMIGLR